MASEPERLRGESVLRQMKEADEVEAEETNVSGFDANGDLLDERTEKQNCP